MIRKDFETKLQAELYLIGEKIRMEKGYLTRSEREELKQYLGKPELLVCKEKVNKSKGLPIVTNREVLSQPSEPIVTGDDIKSIVQALKDTLRWQPNAIGLSAPQIGIKKNVCFISIPSINKEKKSIEYHEKVLINPRIIEKSTTIQVKGEGCCSFPGIRVDTDRYVYCTVEFLDEDLKPQVGSVQDLEAFAIQHEVDHLLGTLIFDRKHRAK